MKFETWDKPCKFMVRVLLLPSALLLLIHHLPMNVIAQTLPTTSTTTLASGATLSAATSLAAVSQAPSMTTRFKPFVSSNTTTSALTTATTAITNDILPGNSHPSQGPSEGLFHYYWLILALLGAFVAIFLWWINRRRRRRKEQMRLSGQNALARDMEGWVNTRRWFHGNRRNDQTHAFSQREEGLNEQGEAPPPYQPKDGVTITEGTPHDPVIGLPIPLRTLSREEVDAGRPPGYREVIGREHASTTESSPTNSHNMRLETIHSPESPPSSSVNTQPNRVE